MPTSPANLVLVAALGALGCGASPGEMPAVPQRMTLGALRGPLCTEQYCRCADKPADAGLPQPPAKRFEIQVGPTGGELWVQVGDNRLYKSPERPTDCFYVDLSPGEHPVSMRGHDQNGFGAMLAISEIGARGPWKYDTFSFECGTNVCTADAVKDWMRRARELGPEQDPCGSTKVTGVRYQMGRLPDGLHPADLYVELDLKVYKFVPEHPPGDPECAR